MQIVAPRMKGFIALDSHPVGCSSQVKRLVESVGGEAPAEIPGAGPVVVIGSSGGYGLPAAAVAAFRYRRPVVGVCLERPAQRGRTATAGWYNSVALSEEASRRDANIVTVNADCFSDDTKQRVIDLLRTHDHPPSALVYSVAAPVRTDPTTGTTFRSVLKPIGEPFVTKTVKLDSGEITNVTLEPATEEEIDATIQVMGGDDWRRWIDALGAASLLEPPFRTVAFDYVGPSITHPIYRSGTIGCAKAHLERTANGLDEVLAPGGGGAWASVNAAAITQSSAAIPAVPLYLSLLLPVARDAAVFETPADQMVRLFDDYLTASEPVLDDERRFRLDEWELDDPIQEEVARRWDLATTENFETIAAFNEFQLAFRQLFGFDVPGVDYDRAVEPDVAWPG